jgi:eukaryotic-like serine/threonine-protein kinase
VVGTTIAGRYEVEEVVGHGGMSSVYKAHDSLLERHVALKILHERYNTDDEFVERFKREARSVAQLQHPCIVTVIDRGEQDGRQYIVFEYIDGENLKEHVVRQGRLDIAEALEIAIEVAGALAFAHDHGLVHRDVKPQNVLLNGDGRPKVTDFGIARSLDVDTGMTQTGTVLGTSNYIAPEQASGGSVDQQTDVYSLGVVLYELLAGDVPFPGESFLAIAMKHVNEPPPNLLDERGDIPLRVAAAVDRALEKDPAQRFPSMKAFAAELEACLAGLRTGDGDTSVIAPPKRKPRRKKHVSAWSVATIALALLALGAIAAGLLLFRNDSTDTPADAATKPIALDGIASYDPYGDDREHDEVVGNATDRNPGTYWTTETYHDLRLGKPGVGLVLDAGDVETPSRIVLDTNTPGFTAQIGATNILGGVPQKISPSLKVGRRTTFELTKGSPKRYFVVWITALPPGEAFAHVDEVRAFGS